MAFSYRELFCGGKTFCCCLPVRLGAIVMSILGILFGGLLSIILWFEIASTHDMDGGTRASFVVVALIETLLFVASALGFVGAIVRKQSFLQIYAYFTYLHLLLNIGVAGYILYLVTHFTNNAALKVCQDTVRNQQAQGQCTGLLKVSRGVYIAIAAIILLIELYVAIVVTRYVNQVKSEKRSARASRLGSEEAFALVSKSEGRYTPVSSSGYIQDNPSHYSSAFSNEQEFNPYEGLNHANQGSPRYTAVNSHVKEERYGGEPLAVTDTLAKDKTRLKDLDEELEGERNTERRTSRHERQTSIPGVSSAFTQATQVLPKEIPRYTLTDPYSKPASG